MKEKLPFGAFYIGIPGLIQKLKVPKWVCRSTLASFCSDPPFFAIFGPARGQIYREKIAEKLPFWALYIGNPIVRSEIGGSGSEKNLCTLLGPNS